MNAPQRRLKKPVVFVGMMGSGKTTVGRGIAKLFDVQFTDTDAEVERAAGIPITEIFARHGEAEFRSREAEAIRRVLQGPAGSVAVGGGAFVHEDNRLLIKRIAVSVWLQAGTLVLWNRVRHKTTRPLLQTDDPFMTLKRLVQERAPVYRTADIHILSEDTAMKSDTVRKAADALLAAPEDLGIFSADQDANAADR